MIKNLLSSNTEYHQALVTEIKRLENLALITPDRDVLSNIFILNNCLFQLEEAYANGVNKFIMQGTNMWHEASESLLNLLEIAQAEVIDNESDFDNYNWCIQFKETKDDSNEYYKITLAKENACLMLMKGNTLIDTHFINKFSFEHMEFTELLNLAKALAEYNKVMTCAIELK